MGWKKEEGAGAFLGVNLISGRYFRALTFGNESLNLEEERQTEKCALFQIAFSPRCNHPSTLGERVSVSVQVYIPRSRRNLSLSLSLSFSLDRHSNNGTASRDTNCIVIPVILRNV